MPCAGFGCHFLPLKSRGESRVASAHLQPRTSSRKVNTHKVRKAVKCPTSAQKKIAFSFLGEKKKMRVFIVTHSRDSSKHTFKSRKRQQQ